MVKSKVRQINLSNHLRLLKRMDDVTSLTQGAILLSNFRHWNKIFERLYPTKFGVESSQLH